MYLNGTRSLLISKPFREGVDVGKLKYTQLKYIILFFRYYYSKENTIKKGEQTIRKYFHVFVNNGDIKQLIQRHKDSDISATPKKKMVAMYGEELGNKKFLKYCERQAYTNSLEYFQEKYDICKGKIKFDYINSNKGAFYRILHKTL